jgi:hypothetical protein
MNVMLRAGKAAISNCLVTKFFALIFFPCPSCLRGVIALIDAYGAEKHCPTWLTFSE